MRGEHRVWLLAFMSLIVFGGCSTDESSGSDGPLGAQDVKSDLCGRVLHASGEISHDFEVDCTGINLVNMTSMSVGASFLKSWTDDTALARCQLTFWEPLDQPVHKLTHGDTNNLSSIIVAYGGSEWISINGCMKLTNYEQSTKASPGIGKGQYETILQEFVTKINPKTGLPYQELSGRWALAKGEIDWCEYGNRDDCPVRFETGLDKNVSVRAPGGYVQFRLTDAFADGHGQATGCRVLIDQATGGMRVDMEIGFWQGRPITEFGRECLGTGQLSAIKPNSFVFESVGVTGPGTYGPLDNCEVGPSFRWEVPRTWEGRMDASSCQYGYLSETSWVVPTERSICTYSIEEDPDRFVLDCTNALWSTTGPKPGEPVEGDFHLDADCDIEYR